MNGNPLKNENVIPIKKLSNIARLKNLWLNNPRSKIGRRNWMIFKLGIVTGLRASDLTRLTWRQVYDDSGNPRKYIIDEKDKKTGKINHYLYIAQAHDDLVLYRDWLRHNFQNSSYYMFPSSKNPKKHIVVHTLYYMMRNAGDKLGLEHLGTHSIRKTFGYIAYTQTHNIVYVMRRLNQSNPKVTLRYIGIDRESMEQISSKIHFDI